MTGHSVLQLFKEGLFPLTIIVILLWFCPKINNILKPSGQLNFLWKFKFIVGFLVIKANNVDPLAVLRDVPVVLAVQDLPLDKVVVLGQGFTDNLEGIAVVMRNHIFHILDKNRLGFFGFYHPKQLKEKVASVIFKPLAIARNTKGLTRKASNNHIDRFRRNFLWQNCVNITPVQISIWVIQLISLSGILIKLVGIHHSELVGLLKAQLNSTNTRKECCNSKLLLLA